MERLKMFYIRHRITGQRLTGLSYGAVKFSAKKKPALYATYASAKIQLDRIPGHYYVDQDKLWEKGPTQTDDGSEIRSAEIVLL